MLSKDDILLLYQIERHCADCIRACMYARTFNETGRNLWIFTHNCYAEIAILRWCKVFGSYKEQTHYKHFFKKCFSIPNCSKLTYDQVKSRLISATRMTEEEYQEFWKNIKNGRDKYFVHSDLQHESRPKFPDLEVLRKVALEMRDIIYDVLSNEESEDQKMHMYFLKHMQWNGNSKLLHDLQSDCNCLKTIHQNKHEDLPKN